MVFVAYGVLLIGVFLLGLAITGSLRAGARAVWTMRLIGLIFAAIPGLYPIAAFTDNAVAMAHFVLFGAFAVSVVASHTLRAGVWLSRAIYFAWVVLAGIPSFVLLPITAPFVGLAGLALARQREPVRTPARST